MSWPTRVPGRFPAMDASAFRRGYRHLATPVEVVRFGKLIGYWLPVGHLAGGVPPLEAGRYRGYTAPKRGTAAWERLAPLVEALDETGEDVRDQKRLERLMGRATE